MCIRRETREKARRSLAFSRVSKPHTHITHMLRQCTSIVYISTFYLNKVAHNYQEEIVTPFKKKSYMVSTLCFCTVVGIET